MLQRKLTVSLSLKKESNKLMNDRTCLRANVPIQKGNTFPKWLKNCFIVLFLLCLYMEFLLLLFQLLNILNENKFYPVKTDKYTGEFIEFFIINFEKKNIANWGVIRAFQSPCILTTLFALSVKFITLKLDSIFLMFRL